MQKENFTVQTDKNTDTNAAGRKKDHIELAFASQKNSSGADPRFYYEPVLSGHPDKAVLPEFKIAGKLMKAPLWISSMTGGTEKAARINQHLAMACREFGLGMGLGSTRSLLYSNERFDDFNLRPLIGTEQALLINLGIAQVEQLLTENETYRIDALLEKLDADGLIIHVNPLQEWLQPEGDHIAEAPIKTIKALLEKADYPIIVKEVGQGMGKESLRALLQLPIEAIDFAAHGGTNFSKVELLRKKIGEQAELFEPLVSVGHSAEDMLQMCSELTHELGSKRKCAKLIISGGVKDFLDGYYFVHKSPLPAVYGQGSALLKYAQEDNYEPLQAFVKQQMDAYKVATAFLKVK
ncbi:MAG: hypothetical protein WD334_04345 [Chitinophagales bacterium]